jgi:putative inorganic carbon (hco3(-)) transporter
MRNIRNFQDQPRRNKGAFLLTIFYVWTFVLLSRPQDYLTFIAAGRPGLVLGVAILIFLFLQFPRGVLIVFYNKQGKLFLAFVCVMIAGIPFSLYPRGSFMSVFRDYWSVVLFFCAFLIVIDSVPRLLTTLLLGSLGAGLYSLFAVMSGSFSGQRLYFGGMFDPNDLAFFALSFLPFNVLFITRDNATWKRLACIFSFLISILLILLTGSRGGFLALLVAFLMFFFTRTRTLKPSTKALLIVVFAVFAVFNISKIDLSRYQSITSIQDDYNLSDETGRLNIWKIGIRTLLENPLTGVGVSSFGEAVGRDREGRGLGLVRWQAPHNMFIQVAVETGIVGFFLYIVMTLNVFRIFARARKTQSHHILKISEMGRIGFMGLLVSGFFLSQAYSIYWPFYIALSSVVGRLISQEPKPAYSKPSQLQDDKKRTQWWIH